MLILLPPSETKRPGGTGAPLDVGALRLPALAPLRERALDALAALSADADEAARILKLGPRQRDELAANAAVRTAPTLPAMDRYTGVLYDALGAGSLDADARAWLGANALVQTAPLGPVGAADAIPGYRLAAGASLPGIAPLRRHWAEESAAALRAEAGGDVVLDLRSKAYVALAPLDADVAGGFVSVVAAGPDGEVRALNHFNKHAKGALVRRLAEDRPVVPGLAGLLEWADGAGVPLRRGEDGGLVLVAPAPAPGARRR